MSVESASGPARGKETRYQDVLRAIGRWLDDQGAVQFTLIENPNDITVLVERQGTDTELEETTFNERELVAQSREILRSPRGRLTGNDGSLVSLESMAYEDFLPALGLELDEAQAYAIILTRVEDQFLLTYNYVASSEGYFWHKRRIVIDRAAVERILAAHTPPPAPKQSTRWAVFKRPRS